MPVSATTKEWRALALDDPLFAVAAWPGKEHGWARDDFYESGAADWRSFRPQWEQYAGAVGGECIEIGCGAGRLTKQLVDSFSHVHAVDVSEQMLALTAEVAPQATTVLTDGDRLPLPDGCADAAFSCHVLQHLENAEAVTATLSDLHRCLRPEATVMLHLLLRERDIGVARTAYAEAKLRYTRLRNANRGAYSRVRRYLPGEVRRMFDRAGFERVELREFAAGSNGGTHAFWFAHRLGL